MIEAPHHGMTSTNISLDQYERIQPNMAYEVKPSTSPPTALRFLTPNQHCAWRVKTLDDKEPDTIAWLSKMRPGEVLFDVGANMGQYALIAAIKGLTVHAFEPESQNFALLCRNIYLNDLGGCCTAWPLALSDEAGFDHFFVQSLQSGGSCSSYGEAVNFHLQPKKYAVTQGCAAVTMDEFAEKYGYPTHVKIDVDGLEHKVVTGMLMCLHTVKSVLVELNTALEEHLAIIDVMKSYGLHPDLDTADAARRTEGAFAGIGNMIFYRED